MERFEQARKAYKWWEAPELPENINWYKLEHTGVVFPAPYVQHNVPLVYDGKEIKLNAEQEEVASFFAALGEDSVPLKNEKTRPVFEKNFFEDFKQTLTNDMGIKKFEKCNFDLIRNHLEKQRKLKKAANDTEKALQKSIKEKIALKHGYALIDNRIEKMGNYNMEPPALFRGRGEHPKTGTLKKRCFSENVAINISEDSCIPVCSLPGHAWQSVRHDPSVTWLCSWFYFFLFFICLLFYFLRLRVYNENIFSDNLFMNYMVYIFRKCLF
jgi:DNA topoisomerase-1